MRGSRQITEDMVNKIVEYHIRRKSRMVTTNQVEIINDLYYEVKEFVIEVGGYDWNFYHVYDNEDKAILQKEHLNKCGCGQFRNFKVLGLYTIWERI